MNITVNFDASFKGKQQRVVTGVVIKCDGKTVCTDRTEITGNLANNSVLGELLALERTLMIIKKLGMKGVEIISDCQSVVHRMNTELKSGIKYKKRYEKLKIIINQIGAVLKWVPREENKLADALTR